MASENGSSSACSILLTFTSGFISCRVAADALAALNAHSGLSLILVSVMILDLIRSRLDYSYHGNVRHKQMQGQGLMAKTLTSGFISCRVAADVLTALNAHNGPSLIMVSLRSCLKHNQMRSAHHVISEVVRISSTTRCRALIVASVRS